MGIKTSGILERMKKLSQERTGEVIILSESIIWGLFPILAILSYSGLSPLTSLAWTTAISFFFFLFVVIARRSWNNVFQRGIFWQLLAITGITGVLFYVLFYIGLEHTSAGNAAIIGTAEILFSFLFFNVWKKEYISFKYIIGIVCMLLGVLIILAPNFSGFRIGDIVILLAVFIAPLGNYFQKSLRSKISSEQILFFRTLIAAPILFFIAYLAGESIIIPPISVWWILLVNGVVLFGITKLLWIESIFRIGVTKSISLSSVSPIFTLIFAYLIFHDEPTFVQIIAVPLSVVGVYLLTRPATHMS